MKTRIDAMAEAMASQCVAHRARQAARVLTRAYDDSFRELGIQVSQLFVLVAVARFGDAGAPIGRIGEVLALDQTTVSRNVMPLASAGYVKLASSKDDARRRVVTLTASGRRMIETAYPRWEAAQRRVARTIGGTRIEALRRELDAVVAAAPALADESQAS